MQKARGLVFAGVVAGDLLLKVREVVDPDGHDLVQLGAVGGIAQLGPQAAERLGQHGRAVVVARLAALVVRHDEEHGHAALILRRGEGGVQPVEAGEHHFHAGLDGKAAGLEVDDAV